MGNDSDRAEFVEGHYGLESFGADARRRAGWDREGNTAARAKAPGRGTARRTGRDESAKKTERETDARGTARGDALNDRGTDIYDET